MPILQVRKLGLQRLPEGIASGKGGRYKPRSLLSHCHGLHSLSQKEHRAVPWCPHPAPGTHHSLPTHHRPGEGSLGSFCHQEQPSLRFLKALQRTLAGCSQLLPKRDLGPHHMLGVCC